MGSVAPASRRIAAWVMGASVVSVGAAPTAAPTVVAAPGDGLIAFQSDRQGGDDDIWVMNADGSNPVNLTPGSDSSDQRPAWSPDGQRIAFQSNRGGTYDIWVMNADGSNPVNLTSTWSAVARDPAWSPDGTTIAFRSSAAGTQHTAIFLMNANGSNKRILHDSPNYDHGPEFDPSGRRLGVTGFQPGIGESFATARVVPNEGEDPDLADVVEAFDDAPHFFDGFSPDGNLIVFTRTHSNPEETDSEIFVAGADDLGNDEPGVNLTGTSERGEQNAAFSPDSTRIAFDANPEPQPCCNFVNDVFVMNIDGTGVTNLTNHGADDRHPAWQPTESSPGLDAAARFVPLPPARLFDTRPGEAPLGPKGIVGPDASIDVQITGVAGVPANAVAVVMNVTVANAAEASHVTVYPTGSPRPTASSVNVSAVGQTRPNLVTVPIGARGKVTLYSLAASHLLADVAGYYVDQDTPTAAGRFVPLTPRRLFDTRETGSKLPPDTEIDVTALGRAGIPAQGVSAVVLNLTGTQASARGHLTVRPAGTPLPNASNVNLNGPGATAPNLAIVPIGANGRITIHSSHGSHALADVTGYITDADAPISQRGLFVPLAPRRLFDTRAGEAAPGPKGYVDPGETVTVEVAGAANVPRDIAGIALNVTGISGPRGHITAWDTGSDRPLASTLNLYAMPFDTRANAAWLRVGADGRLQLFSVSGAHLLADAAGYFVGAG